MRNVFSVISASVMATHGLAVLGDCWSMFRDWWNPGSLLVVDDKFPQNSRSKRAAATKKAATKAAAKAAAKKAAKAASSDGDPKAGPTHKDIQAKCLASGKCFKFQKGTCKLFDCKWKHLCAICNKPDCAAHRHKQ